MMENRTLSYTEEQWANYTFDSAHVMTLKGKKYVMALDNHGNFSYFVTRSFHRFQFVGTFPSGFSSPTDIAHIKFIGSAGFFAVFKNHFAFFQHMNPFSEHQNVCIPGLSVQKGADASSGISMVEPDAAGPIMYALPKKGDRILIFLIDTKAKSSQLQRRSGSIKKSKQQNLAFSSVSQCQLQADIKFTQLTEGGDRIISILSLKG